MAAALVVVFLQFAQVVRLYSKCIVEDKLTLGLAAAPVIAVAIAGFTLSS